MIPFCIQYKMNTHALKATMSAVRPAFVYPSLRTSLGTQFD